MAAIMAEAVAEAAAATIQNSPRKTDRSSGLPSNAPRLARENPQDQLPQLGLRFPKLREWAWHAREVDHESFGALRCDQRGDSNQIVLLIWHDDVYALGLVPAVVAAPCEALSIA